jgi:hypothetical protein
METGEAKNSVHIALAETALVSLTIDGSPVRMSGGKSANITRLLPSFQPPLFAGLAGILALLCGIFSLDMILLSGEGVKERGFVPRLRDLLSAVLSPSEPPPIKILQSPDSGLIEKMAMRVRNMVLGAA